MLKGQRGVRGQLNGKAEERWGTLGKSPASREDRGTVAMRRDPVGLLTEWQGGQGGCSRASKGEGEGEGVTSYRAL